MELANTNIWSKYTINGVLKKNLKMAKKCLKISKLLQLDSTNIVLLKYEENKICPIFLLPVASEYIAKNWVKIHISVQNPDLLKITKTASTL